MAQRTIYDCDSCPAADIERIHFQIKTGANLVDERDLDVCPACAAKLLRQLMGQLDATAGLATYNAIIKSRKK